MGRDATQVVAVVAAAVVGFYTESPQAALATYSAISTAGSVLNPPKGPSIHGPRLSDLSAQSASYGAVIPRVYGTVALLGNVFWLENDQLKETATTESQGGKGGGGGAELTSYSYSATFAVGLCQGPIAGVRRIWVGTKLIYDASATDISTIIASNQSSELFTLYKGSDTQLPDDRMQAALGVANTPAYRGLAYLVFKDFPLADHGNSMLGAQVKVEVVKSANSTPFTLVVNDQSPVFVGTAYSYNESIVFMSTEHTRFYMTNHGDDGKMYSYRIYDYWAGRHTVSGEILVTPNTGRVLFTNSDKENPVWYGDDYFTSLIATGSSGVVVERGDLKVGVDTTKLGIIYKGAAPVFTALSTLSRTCCTDGENCYVIQNNSVSTVLSYSKDLSAITALSIPGLYVQSGITVADVYNGYIWIFEKADNVACRVFKVPLDLSYYEYVGSLPTLTTTGISFTINVRVIDGMIIRAWASNTTNTHWVQYIKINDISSSVTMLGSIISDEIKNSNLLTSADIDVTALTQSVRGYRVSSVAAIRAAIEPLQGAWPFDVLQSGYKIKFKPRGGSVVATIPASDLDARERSKAPGNALVIAREMDSIIPRRVVLKHMDVDREYDQGEQYAERLNTDAVNIQTVEMALAMTSTEAAGLAEVLLYLYWLERYDISFSLPPTYNGLEPADVITINTTDASYQLRLTSVAYTSDGRLECSAKYNSAAIYTPTAIGESGQSTGAVLLPIGRADYTLLDIPLLLDATDLPGFPVAMTGYLAGWSGGSLFRTDDLGQTWSNLQSFTAPGAVMGSASATIGAGRLDLIDAASVLPVYLTSGDLSSITEAQLLGGANHFAYGVDGRWEIIGAQNCVLQGDGSYLLSKLLRGRFGSEWACGLHQSGDRIVLLDSNRLKFLTANLNSIGQSRTYRAITAGKSLSSDSDLAFAYTAVNLECLSPVYLNGNRHPTTSDWSLTWLRRTRVGGEWRDYVDATLGETVESYELEIYSSAAYTTLKRTLTGLSSAAAAYTSAQQVTDFGSNQATLYVKVYQISAVVGRGYPLTTSLTR